MYDFWGKLLHMSEKFCNFADAIKMHRRVKAAAQHSSSELGSAFALHFTCTSNQAEKLCI
jgi:hypothetical protein